MIFFPSTALTSLSYVTATTAAHVMEMITTGVVRNFFMQLFLNPGSNFVAVGILCGITIAPCIGLVFLIKMLYEKHYPAPTII